MGRVKTELLNKRFGRLLTVEFAPRDAHGNLYVKVKCNCGNEKIVRMDNLKVGHTKSCGCILTKF